MNARLKSFESFSSHAWFGRLFKRLTQKELSICRNFLAENEQLDASEFEIKVNRMFLDRPKPKNHTLILELLTCSNSAARSPHNHSEEYDENVRK